MNLPEGTRIGTTRLDKVAWFALRALVVAVAGLAVLWTVGRLRLVLLPIAAALLLAAPLRPVADRLQRVLGRTGAAVVAVVGLLALVGGSLTLAGSAVASDASELRTAVEDGMDDLEGWLVDGPAGLERDRVQELRSELGQRGGELLRGGAVRGATAAAQFLAGLLLALVIAVFAIRDGDALTEAIARRSPPRQAARIRLGSVAAWSGLRRYLLGAALLGLLEAVVIGATVALVGSPLAIQVAVFTFLAAFVPLVGAVVAGIVAVLAALVGGGPGAALLVGGVALVVQQLDGDLLGPLIYGRATQLHPVAVLVAIATGTAVGGLAGAVLAVPLTTVAVSVLRVTDHDTITRAVEATEEAGDDDAAGRVAGELVG